MLEHLVEQLLDTLIPLLELMGIVVVALSALIAFIRYSCELVHQTGLDVKIQLGKGMALGLEFKMAAEILKTVLIRELEELVVLGAIILLRALLSFLIHFEMKQAEHG